jgi:hypothetical protein
MLPEINQVSLEDTGDRLKATLPVRRNWPWLFLFSLMLILWVIGLIWGIIFTIRDIAFSGERYAIVFTIMLLIWLYIWYRLGKIVWKQWQYYVAGREILFIDKERLIIRRPVSLLGITDAYDFDYVSPFFHSEKHACPGFDYGKQRIYFGQGLPGESSRQLVNFLNERYFSAFYDDDDY